MHTTVITLALAVSLVASGDAGSVAKVVASWGIRFDATGFDVQELRRNDYGKVKQETLEARKGQLYLKIVRIEGDDHEMLVSDKRFLLESLFEPATAPYPEAITTVIQCPEKFIPRETVVKDGSLYSLFAGKRFNYGICVQDLVKYRSVYGIFDCKKKGVFEIYVFAPEAGPPPGPIAASFACH